MFKPWVAFIFFSFNFHTLSSSSSSHQDPIELGILKKPQNCNITKCGSIDIPYPFGIINSNCSHNHFFDITCNTSSNPPTPFLTKLNLQVIDFTSYYYQHVIVVSYPPMNICIINTNTNNTNLRPVMPLINLTTINTTTSSPYRLPSNGNDLVVNGCYAGAAILSSNGTVLRGCTPLCSDNKMGDSICQTPLPYLEDAMESYQIGVTISNDTTTLNGGGACVLVGLGTTDYNTSNRFYSSLPPFAILQWTSKGLNKSEHVNCTYDQWTNMEFCECQLGYHGNPYLPNGCQVPQECKGCRGKCVAYSYHYSTLNEDAEDVEYRCETKPLVPRALASGLFAGTGSVIVLLGVCLMYRIMKRMSERRRRARNFKQNGGLLLKQRMDSNVHSLVEKSMVFTTKELEKATDNFNKNRVLGQGGQGTVYKGMLTDGRIVAIKKAKKVDEKQCQQFINEVFILSQINHRNIVKLLGCCLETDVPLLVYEYVPNGMLSQHIHEPRQDFNITWQMRLQIAAETAGALAYLHSSSSTPIYHRDIKSSNILLDEKYKAKVADFGISRVVSIDQTHLTTDVVGTFGYLDPEYFRSNQFTEKSDVYSFGIVLLELLTGKKPIRATESEKQKSLAMEFLELMERSSLDDILDPCVEKESKEELVAVAKLASQCLSMVASNRPTMKEVTMSLEGIRCQQPWSLGRVCREVEYDTSGPTKSHPFLRSSSCTSSFLVDI